MKNQQQGSGKSVVISLLVIIGLSVLGVVTALTVGKSASAAGEAVPENEQHSDNTSSTD